MPTAEDVLRFWFGSAPAQSESELRERVRRWYEGGDAMDGAIREQFGTEVERALTGELDDWAATPRGLLALVLVLDQFPRGLFRGSPRAFAGDAKAIALVEHAFARGFDRELDWEGRQFLFTPYLHGETLASQQRALELFTRASDECPQLNRKAFRAGVEQAQKYRDVLQRFDRFPHRNDALGRKSSAEEIEFLRDWAQAAPPRSLDEEDDSAIR